MCAGHPYLAADPGPTNVDGFVRPVVIRYWG